MTDSLATFATTGKFSFKSFTTSVLSDLAKIAARIAMSSALEGIFGAATSLFGSGAAASGAGTAASGFSTGAYSNLSLNAKGGVYNSPSLSAYSNGIVSSPTMFAFAKGAGLMGEAGPEAIMPLTRGSDGSLGVRAVGGSSAGTTTSAAPQVYITIDSSGDSSSQSTSGWEQFGSQIANYVNQLYQQNKSKDLRPGGDIWNVSIAIYHLLFIAFQISPPGRD